MGLAIGNDYNNLNYSTKTTTKKNNSVTAQEESSNISTEKKNPHLNEGTIKFVMENGMAKSAEVDGINVSLTDLLSTNKSQLKERINEEYNKTDAEKLEEIFGL